MGMVRGVLFFVEMHFFKIIVHPGWQHITYVFALFYGIPYKAAGYLYQRSIKEVNPAVPLIFPGIIVWPVVDIQLILT